MSLKFGMIRPRTAELAALERLKKFPKTSNWENLDCTLEPSFLFGSFLFLQVMRTIIKAWTSMNLGRNPLPTSELAALERLKKSNYKLASSLVL